MTGSNFARGARSATSSSAVGVGGSLTRPKSNGCVSLIFLLHIILTTSKGGCLWRYTYPSIGLIYFEFKSNKVQTISTTNQLIVATISNERQSIRKKISMDMMLRHTGTFRAPARKTDWSGFEVRTLIHAYISASANGELDDYPKSLSTGISPLVDPKPYRPPTPVVRLCSSDIWKTRALCAFRRSESRCHSENPGSVHGPQSWNGSRRLCRSEVSL